MPAEIYQCQTCGERFAALTLRKCPACREPVPDSVLASGAKVIDFMQRVQQAASLTGRAGEPTNALAPRIATLVGRRCGQRRRSGLRKS